jgi:hypothetical protein
MINAKINMVMSTLKKLAFTTKFMAVTIVPGPAIIGMANGEMATPSSNFSFSWRWILDFFDWSISNPIKKIKIPPNTLKAGIVSPKIWKIYLPINMNATTIIKATILAVFDISLFPFSSSPSVNFTKKWDIYKGVHDGKKCHKNG